MIYCSPEIKNVNEICLYVKQPLQLILREASPDTGRLQECSDETLLVELAAMIAWENYRARFNRVFGVRPSGFSEGAFRALPERH